jgi:hypothetical protein
MNEDGFYSLISYRDYGVRLFLEDDKSWKWVVLQNTTDEATGMCVGFTNTHDEALLVALFTIDDLSGSVAVQDGYKIQAYCEYVYDNDKKMSGVSICRALDDDNNVIEQITSVSFDPVFVVYEQLMKKLYLRKQTPAVEIETVSLMTVKDLLREPIFYQGFKIDHYRDGPSTRLHANRIDVGFETQVFQIIDNDDNNDDQYDIVFHNMCKWVETHGTEPIVHSDDLIIRHFTRWSDHTKNAPAAVKQWECWAVDSETGKLKFWESSVIAPDIPYINLMSKIASVPQTVLEEPVFDRLIVQQFEYHGYTIKIVDESGNRFSEILENDHMMYRVDIHDDFTNFQKIVINACKWIESSDTIEPTEYRGFNIRTAFCLKRDDEREAWMSFATGGQPEESVLVVRSFVGHQDALHRMKIELTARARKSKVPETFSQYCEKFNFENRSWRRLQNQYEQLIGLGWPHEEAADFVTTVWVVGR